MRPIQGKKLFISNTSINTFKNCKRRFKYKYIDKVNINVQKSHYLSFGISMHNTLAEYNNLASGLQTYNNSLPILKRFWNSDGYKSKEDEENYYLKAEKMLQSYCNDRKDLGKIILSEEMIQHAIGKDIILCGKLDKVYANENNKIEILDYKTSAYSPIIDLNYDMQLPLYILLLRYRLETFPDIISYYYISFNIKVSLEVTKETIEFCLSKLRNVISEICCETEFQCNPTPRCRTYCEYFEHCEFYKTKTTTGTAIAKQQNIIHI